MAKDTDGNGLYSGVVGILDDSPEDNRCRERVLVPFEAHHAYHQARFGSTAAGNPPRHRPALASTAMRCARGWLRRWRRSVNMGIGRGGVTRLTLLLF